MWSSAAMMPLQLPLPLALSTLYECREAAGATPDTAWVRVKDAGVGIPRAQLGRIFNRFYRFQPRGSQIKGTGLGLYIVRSIAKRHGGRVFAESSGENRGSTFTLELPRVAG